MADEPVSYYPPDLPLQVTNVLEGTHTIDAKRLGKKPRVVARIKLTLGDEATPHGKRPDNLTDDQIAAELWSKLEADAEKHCKGHARYEIIAVKSKPRSGPTPDNDTFELEVGDAPSREDRDADHRGDFLAELRQAHRDRHREYLELCTQTTKLAQAVGSMASGLAGAWNSVHARESDSKEHALEMKIIDTEREGERDRIRMLEKSVLPQLSRMLRAKAPALALGEGDADKPEIVRVARKLGKSFTMEQLDSAAKILGSDRLRELASCSEAAEVLAIAAWLIAHEKTEQVYDLLRDEQGPMVERLQELAIEEGDKRDREKAAS